MCTGHGVGKGSRTWRYRRFLEIGIHSLLFALRIQYEYEANQRIDSYLLSYVASIRIATYRPPRSPSIANIYTCKYSCPYSDLQRGVGM